MNETRAEENPLAQDFDIKSLLKFMGVAPVISYNYGKQDNVRLKKVFSICMRFIILAAIVIFGGLPCGRSG